MESQRTVLALAGESPQKDDLAMLKRDSWYEFKQQNPIARHSLAKVDGTEVLGHQ